MPGLMTFKNLKRPIETGDQILVTEEDGGCTLAFCDSSGSPIKIFDGSSSHGDSRLWIGISGGSRLMPLISLVLGKPIRFRFAKNTCDCYEVL